MSCWRVTDNRHYDSPARMSDGRLFTDYRTSAVQNRLLASQIGGNVGTDPYRTTLQQSGRVFLEQQARMWEIRATSGDQWKQAYAPPPPHYGIIPDARNGVELQVYKGGVGTRVLNNSQPLKHSHSHSHSHSRPSMIESVPPSICGPTSLNSPTWGVHPDTLMFQIRPAAPAGDTMTPNPRM
jgi:hypothetical protein